MTVSVAPFRVAVVGGGIGGLCTAISIRHHCIASADSKTPPVSIDIYEQAPQYREIGAGVGIGVNAARILWKIGVGEEATKLAGKRSGIWISFRNFNDGSDLVTIPSAESGNVKQLSVHRAEFLDLLVDFIQRKGIATMHTNKRCKSIKRDGSDGEVQIGFEDGTVAAANLVIGCDGIHSAVRGQFAVDRPIYSGRIAYRALIPIAKFEHWWPFETYSVTWCGKNRHFLCFPIAQNKILNIVAFVGTKEEELGDLKESWTTVGERKDVVEAFKLFEEKVHKLIALMPDRPSKWLLNDREPLDEWVYLGGKVVLVGDAAHAMLPHQGAGAGQAIEDGYILGRALQSYLTSPDRDAENTLEQWMHVYQAVRLPRAQKVAAGSREAVELYEATAPTMINKPFAECVPEIRKRVEHRMTWIWTGDIDKEFDDIVEARKLK